jgi:hypothetical protein
MIKVVVDVSNFKTADDGDTTHFGGTFIIDGSVGHFHGNDRCNEAQLAIMEELEASYGFHYNSWDQHDVLYQALDNIGVFGFPTRFVITMGEGNILIDPIQLDDVEEDMQAIGRMLCSKYQLTSGDMKPEQVNALKSLIENFIAQNK